MGARDIDPARAMAPARKPLYLSPRTRTRVDAAGESLVVTGRGSPVHRFPIARVDRIVCNHFVDWAGGALTLCLDRGVTVTWTAADGEVLGDGIPRLASPSSLHESLERYLEMPEWAANYDGWLRQRRNAIIVAWASSRTAAGLRVRREAWETLKREYVYRGHVSAALPRTVLGWCRAMVVRRLGIAGLQVRYFGHDGQLLDLASDLTSLLWQAMNLEGGTLLKSGTDMRLLALAFESGMAERETAFRNHLAHLRRQVSRALFAWR